MKGGVIDWFDFKGTVLISVSPFLQPVMAVGLLRVKVDLGYLLGI